MPEVSILMPCYNASNYLSEAIGSILNQTYSDFELILINDGSTDNTELIVSSFNDNRIKYINNTNNLGLINSLNIGINASRGLFIARMDADDIAHPKRLEIQVKFLKENPYYSIVGSYANIINSVGKRKCRKLKLPVQNKEIKAELFFQNSFVHPSILMKADVLKKFNYSLDFPIAEDYFLWVKILENHNAYNLPFFLLDYRIHKNNTSSKNIIIQNESVYKIYTYLFDNYIFSLDPKFIDAHFKLCIHNRSILFRFEDYSHVETYIMVLYKEIKLHSLEIDYVLFLNLLKEKWINFNKNLLKYQSIKYSDFWKSNTNQLLSIKLKNKLILFLYYVLFCFLPNRFKN